LVAGAVIDDQHQRHPPSEVLGQDGLHVGPDLLASLPVDLVGQPELGFVPLHADEPPRLEQRFGLGPQPAEHVVAPSLHQFVTRRHG
jgi:hypothetical protein